MMPSRDVVVSGAVEGLVDEAVFRRLIAHAGARSGRVYVTDGKGPLLKRLDGYNRAARHNPWLVLVDLDQDESCAPPFREACLPAPTPRMCFRVVVRAVEAWLMADRDGLARFLSLSAVRIPADPDTLIEPKRTMVNLARHSRRREIREDMVPRLASGRAVGPAYPSRLIEFASSHWRLQVAVQASDSLRRCERRLRELIEKSP
jgi:hypothetical protein